MKPVREAAATAPAPGRAPSLVLDVSRRIAARYRRRGHRSYIRKKLRWDPLFGVVVPLFAASPHPLLDIGCGLGLLGQCLREAGYGERYIGIDLDAEKIAEARLAAAGLDLEFSATTADALPDFKGNVALLDVLHYLDAKTQRSVLEEAAHRIAPGGLLAIRNVLRAPGWRFRATQAEEAVSRLVGWMRSPIGHYPTREEIVAPLVAAELDVDVAPLWGRTPFNSYLILARRRP